MTYVSAKCTLNTVFGLRISEHTGKNKYHVFDQRNTLRTEYSTSRMSVDIFQAAVSSQTTINALLSILVTAFLTEILQFTKNNSKREKIT